MKNAVNNKYYDKVIYFELLQDYASHPFQLIGSIIVQNYAYYLKQK